MGLKKLKNQPTNKPRGGDGGRKSGTAGVAGWCNEDVCVTDSGSRWHKPPGLYSGKLRPRREPRRLRGHAWTEGPRPRAPPRNADTQRGSFGAYAARGPGPCPRDVWSRAGHRRVRPAHQGTRLEGRTARPGGLARAGAHLSSAARARGPRTLPRGWREPPAGGARPRRAARAGRYRPLAPGAAAAAGGAGGGRWGAVGPQEAGARGAGRGSCSRELPAKTRAYREPGKRPPARPPLVGSALPQALAARGVPPRLGIGRLEATSAQLSPLQLPPASRLHDNSAIEAPPRPAPLAPRLGGKRAYVTRGRSPERPGPNHRWRRWQALGWADPGVLG